MNHMLLLYSDMYIQDKFISYLVYSIIRISFAEILKKVQEVSTY